MTVIRVRACVEQFYRRHEGAIKESHGWKHVDAVYRHALKAVACHDTPEPLSCTESMYVQVASLLHDVDDHKYFPNHSEHENARSILEEARVPTDSWGTILDMIDLVGCSSNGNRIPKHVEESGKYHWLIPRWADRLEAVGAVGVVRCYRYNQEKGLPLSSPKSPRAQTQEDLWELATPDRFDRYLESGGKSDDMISHYYDKLLHVASPPKDLVQNRYLEAMAEEGSRELVEVCLRFGKTGRVDEEYIEQVAKDLEA